MRPTMRGCLRGTIGASLLSSLLLAQAPGGGEYTPVASAPAAHAALEANLKTVRDWLDDKDYASAARAVQCLTALAHNHAHLGSSAEWRAQTTALVEASNKLAAAARAKNKADCAKLADECGAILGKLAKSAPGERGPVKDFKPQGSVQTWMLLLDGAYSDAKTAKTGKEMANLAEAVAEEANVLGHLRNDERWRKTAREVREAALEVARKAQADDLPAARLALKTVYRGCEACHDSTRR